MKSRNNLKNLVLAGSLASALMFVPCVSYGFDTEHSAQPKTTQQIRQERFDKILKLAEIQHAQIEKWHRKSQDKQTRTVQKTKSIVAMK